MCVCARVHVHYPHTHLANLYAGCTRLSSWAPSACVPCMQQQQHYLGHTYIRTFFSLVLLQQQEQQAGSNPGVPCAPPTSVHDALGMQVHEGGGDAHC